MQTEHLTFPRMTKAAAKQVVDHLRSKDTNGTCKLTLTAVGKQSFTYWISWAAATNSTAIFWLIDCADFLGGDSRRIAHYSSFGRALTINTDDRAPLDAIHAHLLTICETL